MILKYQQGGFLEYVMSLPEAEKNAYLYEFKRNGKLSPEYTDILLSEQVPSWFEGAANQELTPDDRNMYQNRINTMNSRIAGSSQGTPVYPREDMVTQIGGGLNQQRPRNPVGSGADYISPSFGEKQMYPGDSAAALEHNTPIPGQIPYPEPEMQTAPPKEYDPASLKYDYLDAIGRGEAEAFSRDQAFAASRRGGRNYFNWRGNKYHTRTKEEWDRGEREIQTAPTTTSKGISGTGVLYSPELINRAAPTLPTGPTRKETRQSNRAINKQNRRDNRIARRAAKNPVEPTYTDLPDLDIDENFMYR